MRRPLRTTMPAPWSSITSPNTWVDTWGRRPLAVSACSRQEEFFHLERLHKIVVRAARKPRLLVLQRVACGQEDHRSFIAHLCAQAPADVQPVDARHSHVENVDIESRKCSPDRETPVHGRPDRPRTPAAPDSQKRPRPARDCLPGKAPSWWCGHDAEGRDGEAAVRGANPRRVTFGSREAFYDHPTRSRHHGHDLRRAAQ